MPFVKLNTFQQRTSSINDHIASGDTETPLDCCYFGRLHYYLYTSEKQLLCLPMKEINASQLTLLSATFCHSSHIRILVTVEFVLN